MSVVVVVFPWVPAIAATVPWLTIDPSACGPRGYDLRMVSRDRRGDHQRSTPFHMLRNMTAFDRHARFRQRTRRGGGRAIAPADLPSRPQDKLSEREHAGTPDPHKVNRLTACEFVSTCEGQQQ